MFLLFYVEVLVADLFVSAGEDRAEQVQDVRRGRLRNYFLVGLGKGNIRGIL